jgi:cytochrome c biogenesis factor
VFASRGWVSFAWLALTAAITIGMWSDYRTEGWSGAWAWAPLDRRWLPVWLALSALLHTVTVSRLEREFRTLHRGLCAAAGPLAAWAAFPAGSSTAGLLGATSAALAFALVIVLRVALRRRLQPRVPLRSERLGMHAAHVGMLLVLAPLAALGWRERAQAVLRSGQSATLPTRSGGEYRFTYLAVSHYPAANRIVTRAVLDVRRDGRRVGRLAPEQVQIIDVFGNASFNPVTRSAILRRLGADVHATLIGVAGDEVTIGLAVDPLIVWLWIGAGLLLLGGAALLWSGDGV